MGHKDIINYCIECIEQIDKTIEMLTEQDNPDIAKIDGLMDQSLCYSDVITFALKETK